MTTNRNDIRTSVAKGGVARSFLTVAWRQGRVITLALLVAAPVIAGGCGKDEVTRPDPTQHPREPKAASKAAADSGWARFSAGDYDGALGFFDDAIAAESDYLFALEGRGWSLLRLDRLTESDAAFDSAIVHVDAGWMDAASEADAYVGKSFTASWSGDYEAAAFAGARASEIGGESYSFRGDPAINVDHPRLVAAEAYIRLGEYMRAYEMLVALDVTVLQRIDPDSHEFVERMIDEIHRISLVISS